MSPPRPKVIGVGLNRTGTKTLKRHLEQWGFRHRTYDLGAFERYREGRIEELLDEMEQHDSFDDWPWPLMYRQIDERFPDAKFVLTVRKDPDAWFRSIKTLSVKMGPLNKFEQHIYGYSMPQGHRDEHVAYYEAHNAAVEAHFASRPDKLLRICWEESPDLGELAGFVGHDGPVPPEPIHANPSAQRIYDGDNVWIAHANRLVVQGRWYARAAVRKARRAIDARR
ncbi:MAG: sulfotransferase [Actinomycetota bacterium]